MKIGIVTTWFERGAAYVSRQYRDVLRKDNEVFIYARGGELLARGDAEWDDEKVFWAHRTWSVKPGHIRLKEFRNWLRTNEIDLVLFNEQVWWPPVSVARELGVRTAAYIDYYTEDTVPYFGMYDLLICNTRRHYEVFQWHPNCHYIPWGTDTGLFRPQERPEPLPSLPVFFHSAEMNPRRKGTHYLLRAFESVERPARLLIHTQVDLDLALPDERALLKRLEASGRLEVIRKTVSAPGLYHLGDVYVYPSLLEGIGLSVPEAQACGLPAIVSDCQPMNEFVQAGISGTVVPIKKYTARADGYYWPQCHVNMEVLTQTLNQYAAPDAELFRLKKQARAWAVERLNWHRNAAALPAIICSTQAVDAALFEAALQKVRKADSLRNKVAIFTRLRNKWPALRKVERLIRKKWFIR